MNLDTSHLQPPASALVLGPAKPATPPEPPPMSGEELWAMVRRNALLVAGCVVLVGGLAFGMYKLQAPTYTTTAHVLVQTDQLGTPSFLSGIAAYRESQLADPVTRKIETEMALILARSNAVQVVQRLGITPSQLPSSPWAQLVARVKAAWGIAPKKATSPPSALLIDAFIDTIGVDPVHSKTAETTSNVLEVKLESTDRELAPRALGAMLDAYFEVGAQQSQRLGEATVALLRSQFADAEQELKGTEAELVALAVRESSRTSNLVAGAAAAAAVQGGGRQAATASPANDGAISQLINQTLQLQSQLDDLRGTFTDQADSVRQLSRRVAESRARLAEHMRASAAASAEFSRLERQRALMQDHYVELRRKLEQIDLYLELTPASLNGRLLVDRPSLPAVVDGQKKKTVLLLGPLGGLLFGLLLASLREYLNPRLRSRAAVERVLGLPLLGAVPRMEPLP